MAISRASVKGGASQGQSSRSVNDQMAGILQGFQQLQQNQQQLNRLQREQNQQRLGPVMERLISQRGGLYNFLKTPEGRTLYGEHLGQVTGLTNSQIENVITGINALPASEQDMFEALRQASLYDENAAKAVNQILSLGNMTGMSMRAGGGSPQRGFTPQQQQHIARLQGAIDNLAGKVLGVPKEGKLPWKQGQGDGDLAGALGFDDGKTTGKAEGSPAGEKEPGVYNNGPMVRAQEMGRNVDKVREFAQDLGEARERTQQAKYPGMGAEEPTGETAGESKETAAAGEPEGQTKAPQEYYNMLGAAQVGQVEEARIPTQSGYSSDIGKEAQQKAELAEGVARVNELTASAAAKEEISKVLSEEIAKEDPTTPADVLKEDKYPPQIKKEIRALKEELARFAAGADKMAGKTYTDILSGRRVSQKRLNIANQRVIDQLGEDYINRMEAWYNTQAQAGTFENPVRMRMIAPEAFAAADATVNQMLAMEKVQIEKDRLQLLRDQFTWQKHLQEMELDLQRKRAELSAKAGINTELFKALTPGATKMLNTMIAEGYKPQKVQEMIESVPILSIYEASAEKFSMATGIELSVVEQQLGVLQRIRAALGKEYAERYQATLYNPGQMTGGGEGGATVDEILSGE